VLLSQEGANLNLQGNFLEGCREISTRRISYQVRKYLNFKGINVAPA
jgi:hypothetical protein